jgi:hypothetical protein
LFLQDEGDPGDHVRLRSKAGAPTNPDWYHNLTSAGRAQVEVGTDTYDVTVTEVVGEET